MADNSSGTNRTWWQAILGTILNVAFNPGWGRRILIAVSLALILTALYIVRSGQDYREDPSLLVPRTVAMYIEAKSIGPLFNDVASWPLWSEKRRFDGQDVWSNKLLGDVAGLLGSEVGGLGTRLPMNWLTKSNRAALCIDDGDKPGEKTWALFLSVQAPATVLAEMSVEPGLEVETIRDGSKSSRGEALYAITGNGGGTIYFGTLGPWLIVSSHDKLPLFALDSLKKPGYSLGRSKMLPDWQRGKDIRGLYDPSRISIFSLPWPGELVRGWIAPDARQAFIAGVEGDGTLELRLGGAVLGDSAIGGKLASFIEFLLIVLGFLALLFMLLTFLVMINWAGWLKIAAIRAGITPAESPVPVAPSKAFLEDAGVMTEERGGESGAPVDHLPTAAPTESTTDAAEPFSADSMPKNNPWGQ